MSSDAPEATARRFASQQAATLEETRKRVEEVRKRALEAHARTLRERNLALVKVNQSLRSTVAKVNAQHRSVTANLRREAISRDVHVRVSRSLESLESLIRYLRQSAVSEEKMLEAVRDPVVSGTYYDRERRASMSGLIQSIQRQLIQQYEFLNVAAHELRTPIMPILANAEILRDKLGSDTKEIDTILRNALRLQRLAENILSATKIDSNTVQYSMEVFDMNQLVAQIIQDMEYTVSGRDVRILFIPGADTLAVPGDRDKVGQVVANLLDNALKFTKEGRVLVTTKSTGEFAEVSIADDGPGIDPQIYPVLFSKFAAKSSKGTGLGLFISKKIVEAHGGTIRATNSPIPGVSGAVFTVTLPF